MVTLVLTCSTRQVQLVRVVQLAVQAGLEALEARVKQDLMSERSSNLPHNLGSAPYEETGKANALSGARRGGEGKAHQDGLPLAPNAQADSLIRTPLGPPGQTGLSWGTLGGFDGV